MKKTILLILALCLLLFLLSGCAGGGKVETVMVPSPTPTADVTPAPTAAPVQTGLSPDAQAELLEKNRELWAFNDPYASPWFYTFTDLDHNGRFEVLAASTQGTGIYTYAHLYEVTPDFSGIDNCYHKGVEIEGPDDWPEVIRDSLPCRFDAGTGRYYYACEGVTRDGAAHQYYAWYALCLENGVAEWEMLASKEITWRELENLPPVTVCSDAQGNPISEEEYDSAVERRFAGMEQSELLLSWTQVEIPRPEAPAETPTPAGPAVRITKNPMSEALAIGGRTWFIAHADNAERLTWQMLDPEGEVYTLQAAMDTLPGLELEALEGDTLAVNNVPLSANGWGVQAVFDGQGGSATTAPAYLYVGDFVRSYDSVISAYRAAYSSGNRENLGYLAEHGLSEISGYSEGVGYALKDLDRNGVPELLIAGQGTDDFSEGMVYDLYTLVDGQPVNVLISSARNRWYLLRDNRLLNEGSGGAAYSYISTWTLSGAELEFGEAVFTNPGETEQVLFYSQTEGPFEYGPNEKSAVISAQDFDNRWAQWKDTVFVPALTTIY